MIVVLALLALVVYTTDEWVAIRRQNAIMSGPRAHRIFWCGLYGAVIGVGIVLVVESRWNALLLPLGAMIGAWPSPRR